MKTLSRQFGQWAMIGSATAALVAAPRASFGAEPAAAATNQVSPPAVQIVKSAVGTLPPNYKPSASLDEVIKLAQSGVGDEVLLAFIENSKKEFNPSPDDIIFLNDLGVSEAAIAALIRAKPGTPDAPAQTQVARTTPAASVPGSVPTAPPVVAQPVPETAAAPTAPVVYVEPAPEQQVAVTQFYDSLAPYGNWVYVSGYGYCWQPTVAIVNAGWRPYAHHGRWLFTDCGWYWQSDYSWGWAAFHYGRWWNHPRSGWIWTPDTVWGSSWVSWRHHDDLCGWAPLPPAAHFRPGIGFSYFDGRVGVSFDFGLTFGSYTFVPTRHFADRNPYSHVAPAAHVARIYNSSTVVNNYTTVNQTVVVNHGIDHTVIAKASPAPIHRLAVQEISPKLAAANGAPERIAHAGVQPVLYRSPLAAPRPERVQHVMSDLKQRAARVNEATPGTAKAPTMAKPIAREANQKPAFTPRAAAVIPHSPVASSISPPPPPTATRGKMSDERVNQYINELKARKEVHVQPGVSPAIQKTAEGGPKPAPAQSQPAVASPSVPRRNAELQSQSQPTVRPAPAVQPVPPPSLKRSTETPPSLRSRTEPQSVPQPVVPQHVPQSVPQQTRMQASPPVLQVPTSLPQRSTETPLSLRSRTEPLYAPQPVVPQRVPQTAPQQPFVKSPTVEPYRGNTGRPSAPTYVPPPNPPRGEATAPSGKSTRSESGGQEGVGRTGPGGPKSERNDRK